MIIRAGLDDWLGGVVSKATSDGLQQLANSIVEAVGTVTTALGTFWAYLPTPQLTGGGSDTADLSGQAPPMSEAFSEILGWVMWISIAIAVMSLMFAWTMFGMRRRQHEAGNAFGRIGIVLVAVAGVFAASALVAGVLPSAAASNASAPVAFIQNSLWWYTGGLAVLAVIVGCTRMMITQRVQPAKDTLRAVLTLLIVSTVGVLAIGMLTAAMDALSVWILRNSVAGCDVSSTADSCFGANIAIMLSLTASSPIGVIGVIILGGIAVFFGYIQLVLMIIRGGMLVLLAGTFPISASITNTEVGLSWFKKFCGWTLAFIVYKPVAALVYATAFQLTGTNVFKDDGTGLIAILTGLALMAMALVALPVLMKFIAPMVAAVGGGGGAAAGMALAGAAGGAVGEMASGAARHFGGAGTSGGGGGGGQDSSSSSASGSSLVGKGPGGGGSGSVGQNPAQAGSAGGSAGGGAAVGAGAGGGAAAGGGGAAAAGGASGAAAAAGPAGVAVMGAQMLADKAKQAGQAAAGAARAAAEDTTGAQPG